MEKDFLRWHGKKRWLHKEKVRPFFREREIWFCYLGANVGFEEDGSGDEFLRPAIILRRFSEMMFFAIPLTRTARSGKDYFNFTTRRGESTALLAQAHSLDTKRLRYKISEISKEDFDTLLERFLNLFKNLPPLGLC